MMTPTLRYSAGLALVVAVTAPVAAAFAGAWAKEPPKPEPSMTFQFVRSAEPGCEPDCPEWIAAQGKIDDETLPRFKRMLAKLGTRRLPILIDSTGGAVDGSLAVGRLIRAKGFDVAVTKTVLQPCAPEDDACRRLKAKGVALGLPEARISKCASACVFVLAGGNRRHVGVWTVVGVHQLHKVVTQVLRKYRVETRREFGVPVETRRTLISEKKLSEQTVQTKSNDKAYDKVRKFWTEMGIDPSIMPLLMSAESNSIHWLTRAELKSTNIATDFNNGEQLLLKAPASTPPPFFPTARPAPPSSQPTVAIPAAADRLAPRAGFKVLPPAGQVPCGQPGALSIPCLEMVPATSGAPDEAMANQQ